MTERGAHEPVPPEAVAEFLRGLRGGVESGLDPLAAAQQAAGSLPQRLRSAVEALVRRLQGDYHEDEWGFDEDFAEAVFPLFEFLYETWWRVEADGVRERPRPRARAAGRQPRRLAVPVRRDDDHDGDHEAPPAAAVAALHGPRLGVRAPVPLLVHAPGRRRPREPPQRRPAARGGRAGDGLPRGRQGDRASRFAERYRVQRFGRGGLRRDRAAHRLADRAGRRRRLGGDLPEARREPSRSRARSAPRSCP